MQFTQHLSGPSRTALPTRLFIILGATALSLVLSSPLAADEEMDTAQIKYRQMVMGAIGAHMGAIGGILKNRLDMPGHVAIHAQEIADSSKLIGGAFKAKVVTGATDVKENIWSDADGFKAAIADLEGAANALAKAAASGDKAAVGGAVKSLGDACGSCHETYKVPEEDSYYNK